MVYLIRGGVPRVTPGLHGNPWPDRPWLFTAVLGATAADVRTTAHYCASLYDVQVGGDAWWCGWCLESHAHELLAAGRVREITAADFLSIAAGLVAGDDQVVR